MCCPSTFTGVLPAKAGHRPSTQNHGEVSSQTPPTDSAISCSEAARAFHSSVMTPTQSSGLPTRV